MDFMVIITISKKYSVTASQSSKISDFNSECLFTQLELGSNLGPAID